MLWGMSYPAHLNVLFDPAGKAVEAAVHHTPGHKLPTLIYPSGGHRWACLLQTGGAYPDMRAGRAAILGIVERSPWLHWVKPLLGAS